MKKYTEHSLVFQGYVSSAAVPEWTKMPLFLAGAKGLIWLQAGNLGKGVTEAAVGRQSQRLRHDRPKSQDTDVGSISKWGR